MPEHIRRQQRGKKSAQPSRSQAKPPEILHDFEPPESEHAALDDVISNERPSLSANQVIHLQRAIGNHATKQLLQRRTDMTVTKATHLRTSAALDGASSGETAASGHVRLVQRTPIETSVSADTNLREPRSGAMEADDRLVPARRDQSITVDSGIRMTKMGADGRPVAGFENWYKVLSISGVDVSDDNMWIHTSAVKPVTPAPTETPAPPPTPTPTPTPPSSSSSTPPSVVSTPSWLTKTGDSSKTDRSKSRGMAAYSAYGDVQGGFRANYLAHSGASGFTEAGYKASDDAVSPSALRGDVRTGAKAVVSGARSAVSSVRESVGLGGGGGGGEPSEGAKLIGAARELGTTTAKAINQGDWMGWVHRALTAVLGVVSKYTPFATFAKSIVGLIDKIIDYRAVKATQAALHAKNLAKRGGLTGDEGAVYRSTIYAVPKVKRGVISRFTKFMLSLGSTILHMITLITGGASAMVTEAAALGISLAKGAITFGEAAKGLFKAISGTRGKNRAKNAKVLVDAAFNQQPEALTLLRELNPFGMKDKWKVRAKTAGNAVVSGLSSTGSALRTGMSGAGAALGIMPGATGGSSTPVPPSGSDRISAYPQTNDEMYRRLVEFTTGPKAAEKRAELEKNVAAKLKSK